MDQIVIPKNSLVVLCGPAGCGKSTFAAKNFLPTQVVSSDACRALVCDDATNQEVTPHAFDLMHFMIEKRLLLGRLTVGDATHLKREDRKVMIKISRWFRFNSVAIVFDIPVGVCLERNAARARVVPEEALRSHYELLESTLMTIKREGFNYIFVLNEDDQARARVEVGPYKRRLPRPRRY